ncbi:hypothetical protein ACT6QG_11470 [Xanthobacter sp. TB0136]|uniref:hypothetical protein n=1 Tax=Xanthobacter sp. TB0136 TaxID=3459177 RepID=UPI00403A287C
MSQLPRGFYKVRMELAREKSYPEGSREYGYTFTLPLKEDGKIDPEQWHEHRDTCRVVKFRPDEKDEIGHLVRRPGGSWAFRYDVAGDDDDEPGYRFGDESFVVGEYISVKEDEEMHTYRIISVEPE